MARNPFKPTAGATPPLLVGRQDILDEFQESIEDGPGAPGLLQLLAGARGVGKTVMLTELGDIAMISGWVVIHVTAGSRTLEDIGRKAREARAELGSPGRRSGSTSWTVKTPVLDVERKTNDSGSGSIRWPDEVAALLDILGPHGTGVCITVDEIHALAREPLYELATEIQMLVRQDRAVALIMAGLPVVIEGLLTGQHKPTTFLRRAERPEMRDVPVDKVAEAFTQTITDSGRTITDALAVQCAQATGGYPFMIQLVGYHVWRQSRTGPVSADDVRAGVGAAAAQIGTLVHAPALKDLSDVDRTFLVHMAADDGPSRVSEVGARMGRDGNYANTYRARLIAAGMIRATRHGEVEFEAPYMREYLRAHATHLLAGRV